MISKRGITTENLLAFLASVIIHLCSDTEKSNSIKKKLKLFNFLFRKYFNLLFHSTQTQVYRPGSLSCQQCCNISTISITASHRYGNPNNHNGGGYCCNCFIGFCYKAELAQFSSGPGRVLRSREQTCINSEQTRPPGSLC